MTGLLRVLDAPPKNAAARSLNPYFGGIGAVGRTAGASGGFAWWCGNGSVLVIRLDGMCLSLSESAACTDGAGLLNTLFDNFGLRCALGCKHHSSIIANSVPSALIGQKRLVSPSESQVGMPHNWMRYYWLLSIFSYFLYLHDDQ